jgi:serine/threonine-protein kinase
MEVKGNGSRHFFMENDAHRLVGAQLGSCELKQLIGSGGMGVVFLAQQTRPKREVAVKVLRSGVGILTAENHEFLARFRREADVIAQLDHINILPIYEYGEQNGLAYLVTPYLEGGSLQDLLAKRSPFSVQESLVYIEQTAAALQYAHSHKIIHRDVKPSNMLFHADGRLVLADFGIARIMHNAEEGVEEHTLTSTGQFLGSVDYMAPEMVNGKQPDHRADIYELGVVLFQMLSGRLPFRGSSAFMVAAQHVQEQPPSLSILNSNISSQVDAVVQKALAKDPHKRYASASELAIALRQASSTSSYPTTSPIAPDQGLTATITTPSPGAILAVESEPRHSEYSHNVTTGPGFARIQQNLYQKQEVAPDNTRQRGVRRITVVGLIILLLVGVLLFSTRMLKGMGSLASAPTPVIVSKPTPVATSPTTPTQQPTPLPAQQAQDTIQHYYDDVNQANYQSAYQLWGADYQKGHPYNQFAAGYATTQHVDIVFHNSVAQTDGSQMVNMTIYARDKTTGGTKLSAFEGNYIVGQENGAWKLLSYHFNSVETPPTTTTFTTQATL